MDLVLQKGIDDAACKHLAGWSDAVSPAEGRGIEWAALRWHELQRSWSASGDDSADARELLGEPRRFRLAPP